MTHAPGTDTHEDVRELDPLALPLHGSRLIEASAGTGKTYTIAALYLRLVLGHGPLPEGCGALTPPQILVMTFTEAATQELRERIRDGLATAARVFRAEAPEQVAGAEPVHLDLRAQWPDPDERAGAARRLEVAAEWMDESAVSTIHSWCQRVLREHAFASGSPFRQELAADQRELLAEAARDFWRSFMYPQSVDALLLLRGAWGASPEALLGKVRALLGRVEPLPPATEALTTPDGLNAWLGDRLQRLAAMKQRWNEDREAVEVQFRQLHRDVLNGNKYQKPEQLLEAMREWADTPGLLQPRNGGSNPLLERMSAAGMAQEGFRKKGQSLPADLHPAFIALNDHAEVCADESERLLKAAAAAIDRRFRRAQQQRAQIGFNDLLTRLRDALYGPDGEALARTLRERFPVALIDEFQDTDPDQYRIFDRVYRIEEDPDATGLLLIGDPKQAIYRFRGADIHSYLRARHATAGRHYTLPKNFRSVESLVAGVNHLFARAEAWPDGAFGFGGGELPFHPVTARGRSETLTEHGTALPALTLWQAGGDEPVGIRDWRASAAAACASRMVELLNGGEDGHTGFVEGGDAGEARFRRLRPRDMAVLVRDRKEAAEIERALRERGVRSVYLSGGDSVYTTAEAGDLLRWLRACAEPTSERLLRAALATPTLGLPLPELHRLTVDELRWEARVEQFRAYRRLWQARGVLPMLRALLHDFDVPRALLADEGGERALTNLLHLSELLQEADAELDGEQALIRHLAEHRNADFAPGDEQVLRLESDEDLVKVVTLHKSKGLEYPLVFLPFVCGFREVTSKDVPFLDRSPGAAPQWRFHMDDAAKERQQREQRAEDLRLLYVGMTRARHACWMAIAPVRHGNRKDSDLHRTAVGYLLFGPEGVEPPALAARMEELRDDEGHVRVEPLPPPAAERCRAGEAAPATGPARVPRRRVREPWWVASYSAIARREEPGPDDSAASADAGPDAPDTAEEDILREDAGGRDLDADSDGESGADTGRDTGAVTTAPAGGHHDFPHGPEPGTFLHGLLEWAGEQGFARVAGDRARLHAELARRCGARGWDDWVPVLEGWLHDLLAAEFPLDGAAGFSLAGLDSYQPELEFLFETRWLHSDTLDAAVRRDVLPGEARPPAGRKWINGMLKGFVDLVFRHGERYYVADYKSNRLGAGPEAYTTAQLNAAVLDHRYDLQLVLYTLALHRLLKARLPGYDFDTHMGGGVYLFLRGVDAPGRGVFHQRPPRELIEWLDRAFAEGPDRPAVRSTEAGA